MTTRPTWLAGARAPRRALDALDALASVTTPVRRAEVGLAALVAEPLTGLTARAEAPPLLERALARIETPAEREPALPTRVRRGPSELPAPSTIARAATDAEPARTLRRSPATIAAASPDAVKAAIDRALAQVAARDAATRAPSPADRAPTTSAASTPGLPAARARRPAAAHTDAPAPAPIDAPAGLSAWSARIAGGAHAAARTLASAARDPSVGATGARGSTAPSEHRPGRASAPSTDPGATPGPRTAAPSPAMPAPSLAALAPSPAAGPAPIATARAPQPAPGPAPRGLAGLVAQWNRGATTPPPPSASAAPAAAPPSAAAILDTRIATAAPAITAGTAGTAGTAAPAVGELVALDQLTHAIERVLLAEVRRHGLVVEDS